MHLFINAPLPESAVLQVKKEDGRVYSMKLPFKEGRRADMLAALDRLLKRSKGSPEDIKGVAVMIGPGHFSYLRTSVSIANAFGFCLSIPVIGLTADQFSSQAEFIERAETSLKKRSTFKPVMPLYGKEPNITRPKIHDV